MVVFEEINLFRAHSTEATPSDVPFGALSDIQREVPGEDSRSYSILRLSYLQRRRGQTWVTKTFKTPKTETMKEQKKNANFTRINEVVARNEAPHLQIRNQNTNATCSTLSWN